MLEWIGLIDVVSAPDNIARDFFAHSYNISQVKPDKISFRQNNIQPVQQSHGLRQGEFGLFQDVQLRSDSVIGSAGKIRFGQVGVHEAAAVEVGKGAVGLGQVSFLEGHVVGNAAHDLDLLHLQARKCGMVEHTVDEIHRFEDDELVLGPGGLRPIHADHLRVLEACAVEGAFLEIDQAEVALLEFALVEAALLEDGFGEVALDEGAGDEVFLQHPRGFEDEFFELLGGVFGLRGGEEHSVRNL